MRPTALILLGALCAAPPAAAQRLAPAGDTVAAPTAPPTNVLSLDDAVAAARAHHPRVEAAAGRLLAARGAARQHAAFTNPSLEVKQEGVKNGFTPDRFLVASVPLDISGRKLALRAAGGAAVTGARADSAAAIRDVEYLAAASYWKAALADALVKLAAEHRAALDDLAAYDAVRLREGAVAEGAALRTRLEADRARIAEASARAEGARARADLARALGMAPESIPALEPLPPPEPTLPTVEDALRRARSERPELKAADAQIDAARHRRTAERLGFLPELALIGGYKEAGGVRGGVFGVSVPLPLVNRNGGAREQAAGELRVAESHRRETELQLQAEVASSLEAIEELLRALPPEQRGLGARGDEVARIVEGAYREGGATLVELLEARRAAADAHATALRWAAELRLALLDLNRATGAPILENQR
jgi:cobalt-zinc-cadmium efflux system outer membrane protein